jgi:hypothetical protein
LLRRIGGALFGADDEAVKLVRKVPHNGTVAVRFSSRSRSAKQNAMYWRVLERVVAATGNWRTPEELHIALKIATGHVEVVKLVDGRLVKVPKSIAFDALDQDEAQTFYDAAFRVICDEVMGGMSLEELLDHIGVRVDAAA